MVPFLDLSIMHAPFRRDFEMAFQEILSSSRFVGGSRVAEFEENWAEFCDAGAAIGVGNGTDAIEVMLRCLGLPAGSEVIVPANTFIATVEAVDRAGLRPTLCDVDEATLLATPETIAKQISENSRVVLPVHLYGALADMDGISKLAADHDLIVMEDAAQAHGARRNGKPAGALSLAAAYSFYPGKNLGALGDAGAITTNDPELEMAARRIANHGGLMRYEHEIAGLNSRLDALQAAFLQIKLPSLENWTLERRRAAAHYHSMLGEHPRVGLVSHGPDEDPAWHIYPVRVPERDKVAAMMLEAHIQTGVHYPVPVHLTGAYSHLGYGSGDLPVSERAAAELLSLPMFPGITIAQQERVVSALVRALSTL